ncbi:MAG: DUF3108 domain-containing protein [Steroidobacteraceae bacterium]
MIERLVIATLAALVTVPGHAELAPFVAAYEVKYANFEAGRSTLRLAPAEAPGQWRMESTADATGLARLVAGGTLTQVSTVEVRGEQVRPVRFSFDDGMSRVDEDIDLTFDWAGKHVRGKAKGEPVDLELVADLQDMVSVQLRVMLALQAGSMPATLPLIDSNKIKTYRYTEVRRERLKTAAGEFDTVVYESTRDGSDRITRSWLAPALGYLTVQMEQERRGRRLLSMYLQRYQPGP